AARFDGRVTIAWDVDGALLAQRLPAMSLQPLLENVFKHTVEQRRGAVRIGVSALRDGGQWVLRVEDDVGALAQSPVSPAAVPASGIGLANLCARLAALHGERAS